MTDSLYERLAHALESQIREGLYRRGEKLPSIREMSRQRGVSISTVQQAYHMLEDRRLIAARRKSGYYVDAPAMPPTASSSPPELGLPQTVDVHAHASSLFQRCEHGDVLNLATAYPDSALLPTKQLSRIAAKIARERMDEAMAAHFSPGYPPLRRQIAKWLGQFGCRVTADAITVTNGCQEALNLCLRAVAQPGDTIAIESPCFVGLLQAIEACGMRALEIPCDEDGLDPHALQRALGQWPIRALALVPAFSNPTGTNMPAARRRALVDLLAAHDIPLVEDDVYGDLAHDGARPAPCKAYDQTGGVLYCSSASKSIAPGLRVGWVAAGRHQAALETLKAFTNVSASTLAQSTLAEFIATGDHRRHLRRLQASIAAQVARYREAILRYFPEHTQCSAPRGGYILWISLPTAVDGTRLHEQAWDEGIGILPGCIFSTTQAYRAFIRISCARAYTPAIDDALRRLGQLTASGT